MTTQEIILSAVKEGARALSEKYAELLTLADRNADVFLAMCEPPKKPATDKPAPKEPRKRHMSASARKRLAAAQKKRWAEWRKRKASE